MANSGKSFGFSGEQGVSTSKETGAISRDDGCKLRRPLFLLLVVCVFSSAALGQPWDGNGVEGDPYLIYTAEDMNSIGLDPNYWDAHFKLTANINLSSYTGTSFNIIGDWDNPFTGVFDGNGHTIHNLTYSYTNPQIKDIGLFGYINTGSVIKNLSIVDPNINIYSDGIGGGVLVGHIEDGMVINCRVEGGKISAHGHGVGGIFTTTTSGLVSKLSNGEIINCQSSATVETIFGGAGGIVGDIYSGTVSNCKSESVIISEMFAGGVAGRSFSGGEILNCFSNGTISGEHAVGGLVGKNSGPISNCYAQGSVSGMTEVGGLVGEALRGGSISDCESLVDVNGNNNVGGLAGASAYGSISNCQASGTVRGGDTVGGLVGDNYGLISNCYAQGSVSGMTEVGGLTGRNSFTIINCYSSADIIEKIIEKIYWTDDGNDKIQRASLDGTNIEDIVTSGLSGPEGIALDTADSKIYWTDYITDKIQRANLDGTGVEDLVTSGLSQPYSIALDTVASKMYWTDSVPGSKIQRANLDGTNVEDLITSGLSGPRGIALDVEGGKMYWTDYDTGKIQRANLDGSNIEDLVTSLIGWPSGIALDTADGKVYWTVQLTHKIQRANFDGTNVEDLITSGLSHPLDIALDILAGKMYWINGGDSKIKRANLNGSNIEDLVTSETVSLSGITLILDNSGGLVGSDAGGSYTKCFWDSTVNSSLTGIGNITDPPGVIGESTANMQTESTFTLAGWDFINESSNGIEDIWRLCNEGAEYPKLQWGFALGDIVCEDGVDRYDLAVLCEQWLFEELSADVWPEGGDGIVNFRDWAIFADGWGVTVDYDDLADFAEQWLKTGASYLIADIAPAPAGDEIVNWLDFAVLAEEWLN